MLDVFNIAKPQNCDIQMFYGTASQDISTNMPNGGLSWTKPRGVSHVYMLLIGNGGTGNGGQGGGSGAVTVWYGAAQNIPDNLIVFVHREGAVFPTYIYPTSLRGNFSNSNYLLAANNGVATNGGAAMLPNMFSASGFFQSVAGMNGFYNGGGPSSTTFLSGGGGNTGGVTSNYGYGYSSSGNGYFQLQPIIVGVGGYDSTVGGIGCGGGYVNNTKGGPGFVLIASW